MTVIAWSRVAAAEKVMAPDSVYVSKGKLREFARAPDVGKWTHVRL
jgi:hypothetical protein